MASPTMTYEVARAIYEYAGTDGLPDFDNLAPLIQISYVEEAEAAMKAVSEYIFLLADGMEPEDKEQIAIKGTLNAVILLIDPRSKSEGFLGT
jgi:hypothetical protein